MEWILQVTQSTTGLRGAYTKSSCSNGGNEAIRDASFSLFLLREEYPRSDARPSRLKRGVIHYLWEGMQTEKGRGSCLVPSPLVWKRRSAYCTVIGMLSVVVLPLAVMVTAME